MKRNPVEEAMKDYHNSVRIKKIHPRIFWTKCNHCNQEFKNEIMYEFTAQHPVFLWYRDIYVGCQECFSSIDDFTNYANKNLIITKEQIRESLL